MMRPAILPLCLTLVQGACAQPILIEAPPAVRPFARASQRIPIFYEQGAFDSIRVLLDQWAKEIPIPEGGLRYHSFTYLPILFNLQTLLAIETHTFETDSLPCRFCTPFLKPYVRNLGDISDNPRQFRYFVSTGRRSYADVGAYVEDLTHLIRRWATDLITNRKDLSPAETFICQVYQGNIPKPRHFLREHASNYPDIDSLFLHCFTAYREHPKGVDRLSADLTLGSWMSTGGLRILGAHPLIGGQLAAGNKRQELALEMTFQIRGNSTQPYLVDRNDTLHSLTHYSGGYVGLGYTYYLFHRRRSEFGPTVGFGWSYFNIQPAAGPTNYKDLNPSTLSSPDGNGGLRFTYFVNRSFHLGLEAKYHLLQFGNNGGTELGGGVFTLEMHIGV